MSLVRAKCKAKSRVQRVFLTGNVDAFEEKLVVALKIGERGSVEVVDLTKRSNVDLEDTAWWVDGKGWTLERVWEAREKEVRGREKTIKEGMVN